MDNPDTPSKGAARSLRQAALDARAADGPAPRQAKVRRNPTVKLDPVTNKPNVGGWRGSQNSLKALELNRARTQFGNVRKCAREGCGQPAIRDHPECRKHGGKLTVAARKRADHLYVPSRGALIFRAFRRALQDGLVPQDLARQPLFRELRERKTMQSIGLALELVAAWEALVEDDQHRPWHVAVARARAAGFGRG